LNLMEPTDVVRWFPEPFEPDDSWGREGEGVFSWLLRSTLPRARAAREFLNNNLSALPGSFAEKLRRDLENRWQSAFFELIVARTLQVLGGAIKSEEVTPSGRRPDFMANFEDGSIVVEATAPLFEEEVQAEQRDHSPLKRILEGLVPLGWSVLIRELPRIGPADSKKEFKAAAQGLLKVPQEAEYNELDELIERRAILSNGILEVSLVRAREGYPAIVGGPGYGTYGDSISRIKRAVQRKRQQVRTAQGPVFLAINASGVTSSFEDYDRALFGEDCLVLGQPLRNEFRATGVFSRQSDSPPTYAGVIGFTEVGFRCVRDPVLWLHPRFTGPLPSGLLALESRVLDMESGIKVNPRRNGQVLEALGPVTI
jgi:hypothetical protein